MTRVDQTVAARGGYISQFDSFRVIACCAVVLQHSLLWNVAAGNTTAWAFVMLLHFSRTAFFFLAAFLLTYSQITRPRSTLGFWRRRYVQIGVPFLVWTLIYWVFTMITGNSWDQAWSLLWNYTLYGYYQLYFVVVLLLLYAVFPALLRVIRASSHHGAIMVGSLLFALLLAADLHYTSSFGVVGQWTLDIASKWPWARNPITYQEQFVAGHSGRAAFRPGAELRRALVPPGHRRSGPDGCDRHPVVPDRRLDGVSHGPRLGSLPAGGLPLVHRGGGGARVRRVDVVAAQRAPPGECTQVLLS